MKAKNLTEKEIRLLENLSSLPQKMLSVHGVSNLTEFVLHELCHEDCFNLQKAAYFIDNPDFDCLKGVAGYAKGESYNLADLWNEPEKFSSHMRGCNFNNDVRQIYDSSHKKSGKDYKISAENLSKNLKLDNTAYYSLPMRHNNHGILIVQHTDGHTSEAMDDYIVRALGLLAFCPVF